MQKKLFYDRIKKPRKFRKPKIIEMLTHKIQQTSSKISPNLKWKKLYTRKDHCFEIQLLIQVENHPRTGPLAISYHQSLFLTG